MFKLIKSFFKFLYSTIIGLLGLTTCIVGATKSAYVEDSFVYFFASFYIYLVFLFIGYALITHYHTEKIK